MSGARTDVAFRNSSNPAGGACLNASNSGMVLFTLLFIVILLIVEALMITMINGEVVFLRIGVVGRSVRVTEGSGSSAPLARREDTE